METAIQRNQWRIAADGESVPLIAKQSGFRNWRTIFDHPQNAAFRQNNPDPNVIHTGDAVWIPEIAPGPGFVLETGKSHRLVVKAPKIHLHLVLYDEEGAPYSDIPYEIWINDRKYGSENRRTTNAGEVKAEVPVAPELAVVLWVDGEDAKPEVYTVRTGDLDPIDTLEGVQDRLNNLGYDCGDEHGAMGPYTEAALKAFQIDVKLTPTGALDAKTRQQLQYAHDV